MRIAAAVGAASVVLAAASILSVRPPEVVTVVLVGDIMLSRNVAEKMRAAGDPSLPFRRVSALLRSADLNFGNLESPFSEPEDPDATWDGTIGGTSLIFAAPNRAVEGLRQFGFRIVALANNHALDQEPEGLAYTLSHLAGNGIQAVGAGGDLEAAWQARIAEIKGRRIAFLAASYASTNDGGRKRNELVARIEDTSRLADRIRRLRRSVDLILVSMHAGTEYTAVPDPAQVLFAHSAIDAGADVVVGSHPHWVQPVERYRRGLIFYSLGNFVFDLTAPATRQGLAVRLTLNPSGGIGARLFPVQIEDFCCPSPAGPAEAAEILRRAHAPAAQVQPD